MRYNLIIGVVILIIFFVCWIIVPLPRIFKLIRTKQYYQVSTIFTSSQYARILLIHYGGIYSEKVRLNFIDITARELNIDVYVLADFLEKHGEKKKMFEIFKKYKESKFDIDRIKIMNTTKFYNNMINDIEMYNELRDIYIEANDIFIDNQSGEKNE